MLETPIYFVTRTEAFLAQTAQVAK
jgi:hypothetical protein